MSSERIQEWLNGPIDSETKQEILRLQRDDPQKLNEAFGTNLSFGTGGMRGIMGVGSGNINVYTIQMATQGLANYLLKHPSSRSQATVFISHDSRHNSRLFALEAARVLAGNGIGALLTCDLRPTPYVSFGVRRKGCAAGIMITASHNPKEYNGYKIYGSDGGQVTYPQDEEIVEEVQKVDHFEKIRIASESSPLIAILGPEFDLEYLEEIEKLGLDPQMTRQWGDQLKITFTPLYGCGFKLVPKALKIWGFSHINPVGSQLLPHPDFPSVSAPNPESPLALKKGIKQLEETQSDLLIATDLDADRVAVVPIHKGNPYLLNGNQAACICLEYICQTMDKKALLPKNGAAITTIVSTELLSQIADFYNIALFRTLTGFKYIGELMEKWEKDKSHTFLFGAEESCGYLLGTHVRDKDAIVSSCLLAEVALWVKIKGKTLIDSLEEIYDKYGYFFEGQRSLYFQSGPRGMEAMEQIMENFRQNRPIAIGGIEVTDFEDYREGYGGLPPSNVLLFRLSDKSKVVIRPSGTEPKLKIYGGIETFSFTSLAQGEKEGGDKLNEILDRVVDLLNQSL